MGKLIDFLVQNDVNFRRSRLPALYADFNALQNLNPDGFEANVFAWCQALARLAAEGLLSTQGSTPSLFILDADESLRSKLRHERYGTPQSLGLAITEGVSRKAFIPHQAFMGPSLGNFRFASWESVPWNIITWSATTLGFSKYFKGDDYVVRNRYIIAKNVEAASTEVGKRIDASASKYDRVMTKSQFGRSFTSSLLSDKPLSPVDLKLLLVFLAEEKKLIAFDGTSVRILADGEGRRITPEDSSIAQVKQAIEDLNQKVDTLNERLEHLDKEAREAVLGKNRIKALASLRMKKLIEATLTQRYKSLHQMEDVASRLQQASEQVEYVNVMEISTKALKLFNDQIGDAARVDNVVERLQQQMGATDEMAAILAESTGLAVDEAELDDELEALEKAEKEKEEEEEEEEGEKRELAKAQKQLDDLPAVPADIISERSKAQSPTTETQIGRLTLGN